MLKYRKGELQCKKIKQGQMEYDKSRYLVKKVVYNAKLFKINLG